MTLINQQNLWSNANRVYQKFGMQIEFVRRLVGCASCLGLLEYLQRRDAPRIDLIDIWFL